MKALNALECIRCHRFIGLDTHGFINGEMTEGGKGWICQECLTLEEGTARPDDDPAAETAGSAS